jgi:hypothetical protein
MAGSVHAYRSASSPPRGTKVVPRIGILPPMVPALPIATFETLKPHAIDIRVNIDPVHWFLSPAKDTRSSLYLEDAATEFQVQATTGAITVSGGRSGRTSRSPSGGSI